jgi:tRNA pseudouridine38-40 synthase
MAERQIKIIVEYKGTPYAGWQVQPGQETVQGALEQAVLSVTGQQVSVIGAGRTDAGVHSLGQVACFRIDHRLEAGRFQDALNYYLPDGIRVKDSCEAEMGFHPIRDARKRRYRYLLSQEKSALYRDLRWELPGQLNPEQLRQAAVMVVGEHDFAPFCVVSSRKEDNTCRIDRSKWYRIGPLFVYEIRGNRFLHSMVRSLVGAMVNIAGENPDDNPLNLTLDRFGDIISSHTDERVAFTAPAHGLYQVSVGY